MNYVLILDSGNSKKFNSKPCYCFAFLQRKQTNIPVDYFILFYFILFYFVLFCFVLFHFVFFCFVLFYPNSILLGTNTDSSRQMKQDDGQGINCWNS